MPGNHATVDMPIDSRENADLVATLQPCSSHSDCNKGEYCCKCNDHCRDCADANFRPDYIPPEDFVNYVSYCNVTDKYPTRCDNIVKNSQASSAFDILSIIVSSFLLAGYLALDLTEAITENALLLYRIRDLPPARARAARVIGWVLFRLRAYLLPFYVIGAVTALIVMNPMKIDQVMLNFLSISFILETDNLFNQIFVHPEAGAVTNDTLIAMNKEGMRLGWLASRVYITSLAIITFSVMLNIESCMSVVMQVYEWNVSPHHAQNFLPLGITPSTHLVAPCDALMPTLAWMTVFLSILGGTIHSMYLALASWAELETIAKLRSLIDVLLTPSVTTLFWWLIDLEINAYRFK
jgi:hypothetical protein